MPVRIEAGGLQDLQVVETVVGGGADGANRLITVGGAANTDFVVSLSGTTGKTQSETFIFLVGPQLTPGQFHKAIVTAFPSAWGFSGQSLVDAQCHIVSMDADWDDESQRVEVRVGFSWR